LISSSLSSKVSILLSDMTTLTADQLAPLSTFINGTTFSGLILRTGMWCHPQDTSYIRDGDIADECSVCLVYLSSLRYQILVSNELMTILDV
jgi:hypothetical protein